MKARGRKQAGATSAEPGAGKLANKAGMLLRNREMEEAIRVITIAKPSPKPVVGGQKPESRWSLGRCEWEPQWITDNGRRERTTHNGQIGHPLLGCSSLEEAQEG